jgi:hypothetical protein
MSSPEEPYFHPRENRVGLSDERGARVYFAQLRRALLALEGLVAEGTTITNPERQATQEVVGKLRHTLDGLALRHFYVRPGHELRIDATDSGFFHWSTLIELLADLEGRDARLAELPGKRELKRRMLERIVEYSLHPRELQEAMIERLYLESLDPEQLFRVFLPGQLWKLGGESSHFWSFASYDRALNRPFVYLIYFGWSGGRLRESSDAFAEIQRVAEATATGRVSLLAFSNRLDERLPALHPRIVKRLVLGPYWSPFFTRNEGELGATLDALQDRLPFAVRFEAETLISERETRVGEGWFSKGQLRQVFWIPKHLNLATRGVSQVERFVCLPAWLAQHFREKGLLTDHGYVPIEEDRSRDGVA